jgi:hypothetical protein
MEHGSISFVMNLKLVDSKYLQDLVAAGPNSSPEKVLLCHELKIALCL